jgi:hypothetical protein
MLQNEDIITSRPNTPTDSYVFEAHERPFMAGSRATPQHPPVRRIGYFLIVIYIALAGVSRMAFCLPTWKQAFVVSAPHNLLHGFQLLRAREEPSSRVGVTNQRPL